MDVTRNDFLGGRVQAWQPAKGYRAGIDAVLLAASVPAQSGDRLLELGCGVGVASLCVQARVPGVSVIGLEREADYAKLAERNGLNVVVGDVAQMPDDVRQRDFDHVIFNPPYFDRALGAKSDGALREAARGEDTPLASWIDAATRRLAPKGVLTMIQDASRLADMLKAIDDRLGQVTVQPIAPRVGRAAHLIILQAVKSSRAPFKLNAPLILHEGDKHLSDADHYTPEVSDMLRHGAPFAINR
ncbi:tRNA1(Val) (adenine(37)-N6)-methyltransferase [Nereida sp. MMG025]|uniref:tRNA1(Val) (adenine(37)-N6)-methyltransferase n=1 Tax=Nereida sp. MMG025 TaxID=2909981 RepID=UPI001F012859|nr:methyltransferase [Nereida sp. MMG025]MCF6444359.1 methyltransferase [Nereida sp. MMG025]